MVASYPCSNEVRLCTLDIGPSIGNQDDEETLDFDGIDIVHIDFVDYSRLAVLMRLKLSFVSLNVSKFKILECLVSVCRDRELAALSVVCAHCGFEESSTGLAG